MLYFWTGQQKNPAKRRGKLASRRVTQDTGGKLEKRQSCISARIC